MRDLDREGFIDLGDMKLEYRWIPPARADRPVLVFLHEGLGCVGIWRDFPDRAAAATGHGVFVYSRAGYGASSPVALPRPLRYMHDEGLEVLPRLLDTLAVDRVILIGHSDGASIALIHAGSETKGRVAGVVCAAPHVFNEDVCVASIRQARSAYETTDLRQRLARMHGDNVDIAFWGWNRAWLDPDFWHWNIEEYLPSIAVPVLVVQGRQDEYGTKAQYEAIAAKAGGPVRVEVLDDCRHSPHKDQPEKFVQLIEEFVTNLPHREGIKE